jgi:hypothetical protein
MFTPAQKEVAFVKGSVYGGPGSGKTTLVAMLLLYLSITFHKKAPVAWLASEKGVDFVIDFFKAENVPLLVSRSRSFVDLKNAHEEALKAGCCGLGIDSTSHFWADLSTNGMKNGKGPRLSRIMRIKEEWAPFAADFQDFPIHSIATGRLGYKWEDVEVENDKGELEKEISRAGTKMKAESDFGHEPDLEIQMEAVEDPDFIRFEKVRGRARRMFKSQMLHAAIIKKSRAWALSGKGFTWKDQPTYKPGYFKEIGECFRPHFEAINIGGIHHVTDLGSPSSAALFQNGNEQSYHEAILKKTAALEDWFATMDMILPGRTDEGKRQRMLVTEAITGVRSKSRFESYDVSQLLQCVGWLLSFEHRVKQEGWPLPIKDVKDADLIKQLDLAKEDFREALKGAPDVTLLEVLLKESVEKANGTGRQQVAEAF